MQAPASNPAQPLLSVVTVCLNRAATIAAAIESLEQQLAPDIEHLVIDGGSTDGTLEVLARYPHLRVISEPDSGLYDAMNKGIRLAQGTYICLLNSDDLLGGDVLAAVRPYLEANYDVVCTGAEFLVADPVSTWRVTECIDAPEEIVLSPATACLGSPLINAKFMNRALLIESGLFDLKYKLASDVDLLIRLAQRRPRIAVVDCVGYRYVAHADSLTINSEGTNGAEAALECLAIADKLLQPSSLDPNIRRTASALRGGKTVALRRRRHEERHPLSLRDAFHFAAYLLSRKIRSAHSRFLSQLRGFSQSGQDLWLLRHIFPGKRNGLYIEIGAYDGVSYSNCLLMEAAFGWSGIAIEPNPKVFPSIQHSRTVEALNVAIGSQPGVTKFRIAGMLSGIVTSYCAEHEQRILREFGDDCAEIEIPVMDIASILAERGITQVDYISIDVEGGEIEILKNLQSSGVKIRALSVENNYRTREIPLLAAALGMEKLGELEADDMYVARSFVSPLKAIRLQAAYLLNPNRTIRRFVIPWAKNHLPDVCQGLLRRAWHRISRAS